MTKTATSEKSILDYIRVINSLPAGTKKPDGYYYNSMYDFLIQHGKMYKSTPLTREEIIIVENALSNMTEPPQKKFCFHNSQLLSMSDHTGTIKYVEGFAFSVIPVHHGWCEINGKVIDITWGNQRIFGTIPESSAYFGVLFNDTRSFVRKIIKYQETHSLLDDYRDDFQLYKMPFVS